MICNTTPLGHFRVKERAHSDDLLLEKVFGRFASANYVGRFIVAIVLVAVDLVVPVFLLVVGVVAAFAAAPTARWFVHNERILLLVVRHHYVQAAGAAAIAARIRIQVSDSLQSSVQDAADPAMMRGG